MNEMAKRRDLKEWSHQDVGIEKDFMEEVLDSSWCINT